MNVSKEAQERPLSEKMAKFEVTAVENGYHLPTTQLPLARPLTLTAAVLPWFSYD